MNMCGVGQRSVTFRLAFIGKSTKRGNFFGFELCNI